MLRARYALVQATVGVGTVIIPYIGVAYTRGGGGTSDQYRALQTVFSTLEHVEREHVVVRGAGQMHSHAQLACHHAHKLCEQ